ncbi:hypothetical protein SUGI_0057390 [Cryptomeria japonica]|nr:hypothetical protein SUGI_0057390 [Cryptomeria japonica]
MISPQRDVGAPFTGASCSTEVGSSSRDPWTTEAQPHIPLASGLFDGASHVHTTTNIGLGYDHFSCS